VKGKPVYPGLKLGMFTVLESAPSVPGWKVLRWKCQCECGEIRIYSSTQFNHATSCGCLRKARMSRLRIDPEQKIHTRLKSAVFSQYVTGATRRNLEFAMSREFVEKISQQPCHYCTAAPSNCVRQKGKVYYYSGIDRVDNSKGYLESNVVACCKNCNALKGELSFEDFISHIKRLYLNVTNKLKL